MTNNETMNVDVAIAGYGPVGQALAIALLQRGWRVAVSEKRPALYPLPRAVAYDHEVARILQGLGVAEKLASRTVTSSRYEWRNAAGQVLKAFDGLDRIAISGWPDKLCFCQPDLETVLDERVRSFGDRVTLLQGWEMTGAVDEGDRVEITMHSTPQGETAVRTLHARWLIGCDGAGSFVRGAMGTDYEDLGFTADWLVVDVQPHDPATWDDALIQLCDPARPTTNVSGGRGRRRLEFMLLPGETKESMNQPEVAWKLLERAGWTPANARLERHAVYTFRGCVARRWNVGRMALAGDAAHLTPPFAAQGLCAGIRDTAALAWRLDHLLKGRALPGLLDSYSQERTAHVRRFIEFAIELGKVICVLDPEQAAARDAYLLGPGAAGEDRFPESRLPASDCLHEGNPHAGELALQARVRESGRLGLFDDVVGHGWMLMGWEHDPGRELPDSLRAWFDHMGGRSVRVGSTGRSDVLVDADGAYARWFQGLGSQTVLVRPDFYVYGAGTAQELVSALAAGRPWGRPQERVPNH